LKFHLSFQKSSKTWKSNKIVS